MKQESLRELWADTKWEKLKYLFKMWLDQRKAGLYSLWVPLGEKVK